MIVQQKSLIKIIKDANRFIREQLVARYLFNEVFVAERLDIALILARDRERVPLPTVREEEVAERVVPAVVPCVCHVTPPL